MLIIPVARPLHPQADAAGGVPAAGGCRAGHRVLQTGDEEYTISQKKGKENVYFLNLDETPREGARQASDERIREYIYIF